MKQIKMLDKKQIYYRRRLSFLKFKRKEKPNQFRYTWRDTFNLALEIASLELFIMHPEIPNLITKIYP